MIGIYNDKHSYLISRLDNLQPLWPQLVCMFSTSPARQSNIWLFCSRWKGVARGLSEAEGS